MRFIVRGLVQGVGFRWFVLREARRLGLAGWVTNREDGAVEVVALGPAGGLSELERALGRGPRGARVMSVEKSEVPHDVAGENTFEIR